MHLRQYTYPASEPNNRIVGPLGVGAIEALPAGGACACTGRVISIATGRAAIILPGRRCVRAEGSGLLILKPGADAGIV